MKKKLVFLTIVFLLLASVANVYGQTTQTCTACNGSGKLVVFNPCPNCNGSGSFLYLGVRVPCTYCGQTGIITMTCTGCNGTGRITVAAPRPAPAPAQNNTYNGPSITLVNNTGYTVYYVYISPNTSSDWGSDRLASDQVLRTGQSVSLRLPHPINEVNRYDIKFIDSDGDTYTKMNVLVSANSSIEFTIRDINTAAAPASPGYVPPPVVTPNTPSSGGGTRTLSICTLCNGKREIFGDFSTSYGNDDTVYCGICERIMRRHYHIRCTRCNGTGLI